MPPGRALHEERWLHAAHALQAALSGLFLTLTREAEEVFICFLAFLIFFYLRSRPLILVIKYNCETGRNRYWLLMLLGNQKSD